MRIASKLLELAARLLPPHRRDWADAMRAEFACIAPEDGNSFALGCLWTAICERISPMKTLITAGRWSVGLVTLLYSGFFLLCAGNAVAVITGQKTDPFEQMLIRHHHVEAAQAHAQAAPYIAIFLVLMGLSHLGAGLCLTRWTPKWFAGFCLLALFPALGLPLWGTINNAGPVLSYAWPFLPLGLLIGAALILWRLDLRIRRPMAA